MGVQNARGEESGEEEDDEDSVMEALQMSSVNVYSLAAATTAAMVFVYAIRRRSPRPVMTMATTEKHVQQIDMAKVVPTARVMWGTTPVANAEPQKLDGPGQV